MGRDFVLVDGSCVLNPPKFIIKLVEDTFLKIECKTKLDGVGNNKKVVGVKYFPTTKRLSKRQNFLCKNVRQPWVNIAAYFFS